MASPRKTRLATTICSARRVTIAGTEIDALARCAISHPPPPARARNCQPSPFGSSTSTFMRSWASEMPRIRMNVEADREFRVLWRLMPGSGAARASGGAAARRLPAHPRRAGPRPSPTGNSGGGGSVRKGPHNRHARFRGQTPASFSLRRLSTSTGPSITRAPRRKPRDLAAQHARRRCVGENERRMRRRRAACRFPFGPEHFRRAAIHDHAGAARAHLEGETARMGLMA